MAKVILGATISLDGFINDHRGSVDALYPDLTDWRESETGKESIQNTGAVVMGRNSYAMAEDRIGSQEITSIKHLSLSLHITFQKRNQKRPIN
jgi:dihydrofolate reductase